MAETKPKMTNEERYSVDAQDLLEVIKASTILINKASEKLTDPIFIDADKVSNLRLIAKELGNVVNYVTVRR